MIPIFKSLDQISTGYPVFEADQVLSHEQLNDLADYADDQIRLTRTKLTGVGVVCGLHPTRDGNTVKVSRGVGVTTDGDLIYLNTSTTFTHFREYDETYPAYPPLYQGGNLNNPMHPAFELLTSDPGDGLTFPLSNFTARTGLNLASTYAVALMESYLKDDDICSGTDCDNLGKEAKNRIKILIVDQNGANALRENVPTLQSVFAAINEIAVPRPVIASTLTTSLDLANVYRATSQSIKVNLAAALNALYPAATWLMNEVFPANPATGWGTRLNTLETFYGQLANELRVQYYYDFLKDVAATYNELRSLLFGDTSWCSPDAASFPKHLLLGDLGVPGVELNEYRTAFYPSPATCCKGRALDHAKFLLKKLDIMITYFDTAGPAAGGTPAATAIKITPSRFEDTPLEERAIPYYFPANGTTQIHRNWSFDLYWRNMATTIQSYNAGAYGGPTSPLTSQIGKYSFFRIEGHIGLAVSDVMTALKDKIKANNLPFGVVAVHLGTNRTNVSVKPTIRYNDLHRIHQVLRQDVVQQMNDVSTFSVSFKDKVFAESFTLSAPTADDCNCGGFTIRTLSDNSSTDVAAKAAVVRAPLSGDYLTYKANNNAWQDSLKNTMIAATQYKANLGPLVKTDFVTPYDTIVGTTQSNWLPWLDQVIQKKDEQEDDKLLIGGFVTRNPSLEHFGGVERGGTFVVVYNTSNVVVADFSLPYFWYEVDEPAPAEPTLTRPPIRDTFVVNQGIKIQPSTGSVINTRIVAAKADVMSTVDGRIASNLTFQDRYVGLLENSIEKLGSVVPNSHQIRVGQAHVDAALSNAELTAATQEMTTYHSQIAGHQASQATSHSQMAGSQATMAGHQASMAGSQASQATSQAAQATATQNLVTGQSAQTTAMQSMAASQSEMKTSAQSMAGSQASQATSQAAQATSQGTIAGHQGTIAGHQGTIATRQTTIAGHQSTIATATQGINTGQSALTTATQNIATGQAGIASAVQGVSGGQGELVDAIRQSILGDAAAGNTSLVDALREVITGDEGLRQAVLDMVTGQAELTAATQGIASSQSSIAGSQGTIAGHQGTIAGHQGTIATRQTTIAGHQGTIATATQGINTSQGTIATATQGIQTEAVKQTTEAVKHTTALQGVATSQSTIAGHEGTIAGHQGTIAARQTAIADSEATIAARQTTIAGHQGTIAGHQASIATATQGINTSQGTLTTATQNIASNQGALTTATQDVADAVQGIGGDQTALVNAIRESLMYDGNRGLAKMIVDAIIGSEGVIKKLSDSVAAQNALTAATQGIATSQSTIAGHQGTIATRQTTIAGHQGTIATQTQSIAGSQTGINTATQNIAGRQTELVNAVNAVRDAITNIEGGGGEGGGGDFADMYIGMKAEEAAVLGKKIVVLIAMYNQTGDRKYNDDIKDAQPDLVDAIYDLIRYFIDSGISIDPGSEPERAVNIVEPQVIWVADEADYFHQRMDDLLARSDDPTINEVVDRMNNAV